MKNTSIFILSISLITLFSSCTDTPSSTEKKDTSSTNTKKLIADKKYKDWLIISVGLVFYQ